MQINRSRFKQYFRVVEIFETQPLFRDSIQIDSKVAQLTTFSKQSPHNHVESTHWLEQQAVQVP